MLSRLFLVRTDRRSWLPAAFWVSAAAVSVSIAVWVGLQPGRLHDLREVRTWLSFLFTHTANPYEYFDGKLDYPPIALLVLSPLHFIPESSLGYWFLPCSIVVSASAGWIFVGAIADRLGADVSTPHRVALVAMILSGNSVRTAIWIGQTTALAMLFGALALRLSRSRPFTAAFFLALCSFKPHLAIGFGLAILLIDGLDVLVIAVSIVISASLLVSAAINQSVFAILASYAHNLTAMYEGPERIRGLMSVRWVLDDAIGHFGLSTMLYVAAACGSLALIGAVARRAPDAAGRTHATAAALLWPLLFLPSQLYTGVMAAPAIWLLMWPEGNLIRRESRRLVVVAAFVLFGILDVQRILRFGSAWLDDGDWLFHASYWLSPLRIALLFGFLLLASFRRPYSHPAAAPRAES